MRIIRKNNNYVVFVSLIVISSFYLQNNVVSSSSVEPATQKSNNRGWWTPNKEEEPKSGGGNNKKEDKEEKDRNNKDEEKKKKKESDDKATTTKKKSTGIFGSKNRSRKTPDQQANKTTTTTTDGKNNTKNSSLNNTTVSETQEESNKNNQTDTTKQNQPNRYHPMQQQQQNPLSLNNMIILKPFGLGGLKPTQQPPSPFPIGNKPPRDSLVMMTVIQLLEPALSFCIKFFVLNSFKRWFHEEIKSLQKPTQHFVWERLNDRYNRDSEALQMALKAPPSHISSNKWNRITKKRNNQLLKMNKEKKKKDTAAAAADNSNLFNRTVIVLDLNPSPNGGVDVNYFEKVVTFIISQHRGKVFGKEEVEVVLLMESPGGSVTEYGFGAAQMNRLSQEEGITTTACVDTIACSGGYLIASQANKLLAAPFAFVGSIGVIMQTINFNKALERYGVNPIVLTAGDAKAPITTFGEITKADKEIEKATLTEIHNAFRDFVVRGRPSLSENIDTVGNGNIFFGKEAHSLNMVDATITSDEYLLECILAGDRVLKLRPLPRNRRSQSILSSFNANAFLSSQISKLLPRLFQAATCAQFFRHIKMKHTSIY
eukprot:CAMPEP_0194133090 /NCGR_PEP_ID=MMETSP0152-20130528/3391_1 /TAXON_ID=1049557 /ORGANISM="Thalassiothrix antarctica, Strain L6-D1" /LENGTH=598 /DNA_ID=CAMNT_0038828329 /DNA_START=21 /DNA_END=1817 /DNA_ORIENTATION=-